MQIIRTIVWVVTVAIVVAFIAMNWTDAEVRVWPYQNGFLQFEWPVGFIALFFFLLGLLPMWLMSKAGRWRLNRRIANLENSVRAATPTTPILHATATQLEAASHQPPEAPNAS